GQKKNQLTFQYQEEIARELGYEDNGGILAVERFMQVYYRHAANVKRIVNLAVASLVEPPEKKLKLIHSRGTAHVDEDFAIAGEKIFAKNPGCFEKNPLNLVRVFLIAQQEGAGLDEETRALITGSLEKADEKFAESPE